MNRLCATEGKKESKKKQTNFEKHKILGYLKYFMELFNFG